MSLQEKYVIHCLMSFPINIIEWESPPINRKIAMEFNLILNDFRKSYNCKTNKYNLRNGVSTFKN